MPLYPQQWLEIEQQVVHETNLNLDMSWSQKVVATLPRSPLGSSLILPAPSMSTVLARSAVVSHSRAQSLDQPGLLFRRVPPNATIRMGLHKTAELNRS